jgi:hypothetical protein
MTHAIDPQNGDIVIVQERETPSGSCSVGAVGETSRTRAGSYAEALKQAKGLAVGRRVDVWTTFRVRWADSGPQTFRLLASHR